MFKITLYSLVFLNPDSVSSGSNHSKIPIQIHEGISQQAILSFRKAGLVQKDVYYPFLYGASRLVSRAICYIVFSTWVRIDASVRAFQVSPDILRRHHIACFQSGNISKRTEDLLIVFFDRGNLPSR